MSNKGRYFSEYGYRVLRTQIPNKELDTVEHFSHIFNQLNIETRYHDINVDVSVIKMQSIWRRKVACSKLLRMKMEQKQM
jgi:alcohol dehydrogenase YqhD (iron-dependent ADH family)